MNWIDEKVKELFTTRLSKRVTIRHQGIENCTPDTVRTALQEAHTKGTQEALAKVEEWVKIHKTITKKKYGEFDAGFITALDDLLHHLQQLKDNKEV